MNRTWFRYAARTVLGAGSFLVLLASSPGLRAGEAPVQTAPPSPSVTPAHAVPLTGPQPSEDVTRANVLIASGRREEAISLLQLRVNEHPEDAYARQLLLSARIAALEEQIRTMIGAEAQNRQIVAGDPDYEAARYRANGEVTRRLDMAEAYAEQNRYAEAIVTCNAILKDYPQHQAALKLKFRVLQIMIDKERANLEKEQQLRRDDSINDVLDMSVMTGSLPKAKRDVFIFDEDVAESERNAIQDKLRRNDKEHLVDLIFDGTNGTKSAQVGEILQPLFAVAGVNYVLLDSAIGTETLTIHLTNETVENVLNIIAKLVNIRYNYEGGTVFVSSANSNVLVSEIIRVNSGLTDVLTEPKFQDMQGAGGSGSTGQGGTTLANGSGNTQNGYGNANTQGGQAGQGGNRGGQGAAGAAAGQQVLSDLERFLDKIPDIVVGWPAEGKIYFDKKSNTIFVRSTPSAIVEVKRLLHAIDYDSAQVLIETRFVDVTDSAARELGIDWSGGGASATTTVSGATAGLGPVNAATAGGATLTTSGGSVSGLQGAAGSPPTTGLFAQILVQPSQFLAFKAQISALEEKGQADTLSAPKILTLNNSVGIIEVQSDISYIDSYDNIGNSSGYQQPTTGSSLLVNPYTVSQATIVPHFTKDFQGINMRIRPSIARNSDVITLTISPTVREMIQAPQSFQFNNANGSTAGASVSNVIQSPPEFDTRRLVTSLHIRNGETVVLGGLAKESEQSNTSGMPFLAGLPVIGQLFRTDSKLSAREHLVIFVTAHIIDPSGAELGDDIRHLRDTARVVLPADLQNAKAVQDAQAAQAAAAAAAPTSPPSVDPVWRRNPRQ